MKIHISQSTKDILDLIGGYTTEQRGSIDIKVSIKKKTFKSQQLFFFLFY